MSMMNKPIVAKKISNYIKAVKKNNNQVGKIPRSIMLNYNNVCNFKCDFCFSSEKNNKHLKDSLSFDVIKNISDQAHELGVWEIVLQGGELLCNKNKLFKLIDVIGPERFQIVLTSNGYFLTKDVAKELANHGVDCVGISISGMDPEEHNRSRGNVKDAHQRALEALDNIKNAGMTPWINLIFGHHNSHSADLYATLNYAKEKKYAIYFMLAMPFGVWKNNRMDAEDYRIFADIQKNYHVYFDTWDMYDPQKERITGCWTLNRAYITPLGDVLPCQFINISLGNIKKQTLKEIYDYGFSIKYFGDYSPICISALNRNFREKYLPDEGNIFSPYDAHKIFNDDDYIVNNGL